MKGLISSVQYVCVQILSKVRLSGKLLVPLDEGLSCYLKHVYIMSTLPKFEASLKVPP